MPESPAVPLITQRDTLLRAIENWPQAPFLAVDTEFVRVDTYSARLCLIQVQAGDATALIDTTAFDDLSPVLDALYAPDQIKVFHAPGQDLEILSQLRQTCPQPLFDTQIAATLLGFGDQLGYAGLIERRLGIVLDKSLSRTDWARRPLRPAELAYAAADVIHLAEIYPALQDALVARGRLAWLAEDCARLCEPTQYVTQPADAWQRLKGIARMSAREQTVAAALAAWREAEAQQRNRPRKWIVDDDVIYVLAQRRPQTLAQLEALNALPPKSLARHGEALIALIAEASAQPERLYQRDEEPDAAQKALLKRLQGVVQQAAAELDVPASFLAPRADLMRLVRQGADADAAVLRGWRREVCGGALLNALN
jgi:ribonuclease D